MGFFDDIFGQPFGGMFDMNGDGKTDLSEQWLGFMVINECMKEEKESYSDSALSLNDDFWELDCEDGLEYGLSPYDFSSKIEYDIALATAKSKEFERKNNWRNYCEDGLDYGVDSDDFDNEDEYNEALKATKGITATYNYETESGITIPVNLSFKIVKPGQEFLDRIKEEDYSNKRQYDAAYYLCELQHDVGYVSCNSCKEDEIEKCNLILSGETVATKYLTIFDGFLYVQAVKEHFGLPMIIEDEDENVLHDFNEIFMQVAEESPQLAVDIWAWVVKEFGPYKKYMINEWTIYNSILTATDDYPDEFLPLVIKRLGEDIAFCNELITNNPQYPYGMSAFIVKALELDWIKEAQIIFTAVAMNLHAKVKDMENLINSIIMDCSNWEELETMEKFKNSILPIIKKMNSKRIQRLYPKFENDVNEYIRGVEATDEKYQYVRRFEWRIKYKDNFIFGVDPLDYQTEEDYIKAVAIKKQAWMKTHAEASFYGIDLELFDSEEEYQNELQKIKQIQCVDCSKVQVRENLSDFEKLDNTVYKFCSVSFQEGTSLYTYLYENEELKIGDVVIVPVGTKNREANAKVVSLSQHTRLTAPIVIENAKKIIRVCK